MLRIGALILYLPVMSASGFHPDKCFKYFQWQNQGPFRSTCSHSQTH